MRRAWIALLFAGCGGQVAPITMPAGAASVLIETHPFALVITRGGAELARSAEPAFEIGSLNPPDPHHYPDPLDPASGVTYERSTSVTDATAQGMGFRFTVGTNDARTASVTVLPEGDGVSLTIAPSPGDDVVHVRLNWQAEGGERFYGLGEYFDTFDQTGKVRDVHFKVDTSIESTYNEVHVPVPSYVSTRGFGLLLDDREPLVADMASDGKTVHLTLVAGVMSSHLVAAADPVSAEAQLQRLAGTPPLWPQWMFAPFQWRDDDPVTCTVPCAQGCMPSSTGADLVLGDAAAMRANKLPGSVIWIDAPWMTGFDDFNFNPVQFPDAAGMIAKLHALGYHVMVWAAPFINSADDTATECGILPPPTGGLYTEAAQKGYLLDAGNGQPLGFPWRGSQGALLDFTNPAAFDFWKSLVKRTTDLGVVGYKLDWDEYVVAELEGVRPDLRFTDGSTAATEHALYHEQFHRAHQEALMDAGGPGFLLARSGDATDAKYASAVWPGDLDNDFSTHRSKSADGTTEVVGGLPSAVNAEVSLAASLHPHFGSDIGGLRHGLPTKEVMARWSEFAAFSTVMELGGGGVSHNVWDFTVSNFDQELLDIYAKYARLHMTLFPYLYSYVAQNSKDGTPIVRAPGMQYPDDAALAAAPYELFFGEDLLVAPVVEAGAQSRQVTLPTGSWVNYWTHEIVTGPATVSVAAPLDTLPLFVRAGAILPELAPDVDTLAPATDPSVVTAEMRADQMSIEVFPGDHQTSFELYDGTTFISSKPGEPGWEFIMDASPVPRTYSVAVLWTLVRPEPPVSVFGDPTFESSKFATQAELDAAPEGWFYDAAAGVVHLKVVTAPVGSTNGIMIAVN
jgi:alpha-D-xyloside xylohydrolase